MTTLTHTRPMGISFRNQLEKLAIPPGNDSFSLAEVLAIHFPGDAYGIVCLFDDLQEPGAEWQNHRTGSGLRPVSGPAELEGLTFEKYLDRFISDDPELRDLLSAARFSWCPWQHPSFRLQNRSGGKQQ